MSDQGAELERSKPDLRGDGEGRARGRNCFLAEGAYRRVGDAGYDKDSRYGTEF